VNRPVLASLLVVLLALPGGAALAQPNETPGTVISIAIPVGAAGGALLAHDRKGSFQLAEVYLTTMAVVYTLKPLVDRTRPDGGSQSFPSGHTASAFAGAAFLQLRYGWRLGIPAALLAAYVGQSRVATKRHYTSDVLAGAAIAVGANFVFTRHREPRGRARVTLMPDLGPRRAGAELAIGW
jgi:membrane-associated phospholipid phosphatase